MPLIHNVLILAVVGTVQAGRLFTDHISAGAMYTGTACKSGSITKKPPPGPGCPRRVCYFTNWSQHQAGVWFPSIHFDATSYCTHIICSRGIPNLVRDYGSPPTCRHSACFGKVYDLRLDHMAKDHVNALKKKNPDLKLLVSVQISSKMIRAMSRRMDIFSKFVIKRIVESGFDGLDLYFPASSKSLGQDKRYISRLLTNLRWALEKRANDCQREERLLVTAILPADKATVRSVDIPSLSRDLDFINLMTYESKQDPDVKWRHFSPLYSGAENTREHNVDFYVRNWIEKGFPKEKIVIGIPAYGSSFSLTHHAYDYVTYSEVCEMVMITGRYNLDRYNDKEKVAWFYHGSNRTCFNKACFKKLVSYETEKTVTLKVKYAKAKGLGGVMVKSLNGFNNRWCMVRTYYPLLKAIKRECS